MLRTPDILLLLAAFLSFAFSVYLFFSGHRDTGIFVGIWVPSILSFGAFFHLMVGSPRNV
ncbi:MAG: hypothetical protein ACI87O_002171 [Planctomycetota bacterium]|jgi:hypothetical protein